jgi:hypothetical protein
MMAMMLLAAWMGLNAQPSTATADGPTISRFDRATANSEGSLTQCESGSRSLSRAVMAACRAPGAATPPAHRWLVRCCLAAAPPPLLVHGGPFAGAPEDARHYPAARRAESDSCCEVESVR